MSLQFVHEYNTKVKTDVIVIDLDLYFCDYDNLGFLLDFEEQYKFLNDIPIKYLLHDFKKRRNINKCHVESKQNVVIPFNRKICKKKIILSEIWNSKSDNMLLVLRECELEAENKYQDYENNIYLSKIKWLDICRNEDTFQQKLFRYINEKKLLDVQVYKKANIDRKLFSKIRGNIDYKPKKKTAIALAIALELNIDETKDLLSRAEIALSPSSLADLIISYFIIHQIYDINLLNIALFEYDEQLIGDRTIKVQ